MPITRRDWWTGIAVLAFVILLHAVVPRYEWRPYGNSPWMLVRVDRWTGRAFLGRFDGTWWKTLDQIESEQARARAKLKRDIDRFLAQ